jgi:hypothetical protein
MTFGNLFFWVCFLGAVAGIALFTNVPATIASFFHPVSLVFAALIVSAVHEHA